MLICRSPALTKASILIPSGPIVGKMREPGVEARARRIGWQYTGGVESLRFLFVMLAVMTANSQTPYQVQKSDGTVVPSSLPPQVLFDLRAQSPAAQQALLPLYQREWGLEQQLNAVKWQALADTLAGLSMAVGGLTDGSAGALAANNAAARAGTPGVNFKGENAATNAQQPAETPESVTTAMYLVNQIGATEDAISRTQKAYGISPTARTPWTILFPSSSKTLTPAEVTKLLETAAKASAQTAPAKKPNAQSVPPDCNVYQTSVDIDMKSVAQDQRMVDMFRNQNPPFFEAVKNWTEALESDLRILNGDKDKLQTCRLK
jgi:hypothetical protein